MKLLKRIKFKLGSKKSAINNEIAAMGKGKPGRKKK
jgi:hypothetical protein